MELAKNSHRNTWRNVCEHTHRIRDGALEPALTAWLVAHGITLAECVFPLVRRCDEQLYTGTLVDGRGRVFEYLANLAGAENDDDGLDDVTLALGPKCPDHPRHDPCDPVTMALMIQRGLAPSPAPEPVPA
ncbi:hypothetical protein ACLD02_05675 [Alloalcanivorax sp. C16-2]|uniref:hypothetical protein n=1 Tax=Alloalcanivorax sp. C16-2 TaxID=3390052 RepID=UPI003970575B